MGGRGEGKGGEPRVRLRRRRVAERRGESEPPLGLLARGVAERN